MNEVPRDAAAPSAAILEARGLRKSFEGGRVVALDDVSLDVAGGEFVAICGPSGCGKSTLLNLIAAIDRPDAGSLRVCDRDLARMTVDEADAFRAVSVGLVFQLHNLLPNLTALENVQLPMLAAGVRAGDRAGRAARLLDAVGLAPRGHALPTVLSGGERQRVAVARALANEPPLLLADEPTGALDSRNGRRLLDLLCDLRQRLGTTLIVVTHDADVAARADRVIHMLDGRIVDAQTA